MKEDTGNERVKKRLELSRDVDDTYISLPGMLAGLLFLGLKGTIFFMMEAVCARLFMQASHFCIYTGNAFMGPSSS